MLRALTFSIFAIILLALAFPARAEVLNYEHFVQGDKRYIRWLDIADDTVKPAPWPGGKGNIFIDGADSAADFKFQFVPKGATTLRDIDTDQMPDGFRFSSASTNSVNFELPEGTIGITFTSTGVTAFDTVITPVYEE